MRMTSEEELGLSWKAVEFVFSLGRMDDWLKLDGGDHLVCTGVGEQGRQG